MKVTLDIPDDLDFQFVYRLERRELYSSKRKDGFEFICIKTPLQGIRRFGLLRRHYGLLGTIKAIAKLVTGIRMLYLVVARGAIQSDGWCKYGRCKYYRVERNSVVIGPIWSSPDMRGHGLATYALECVMDECIRNGRTLFYIDTSKTNLSAQRVFQKCGFGAAVALYLRL